MSILRVGEHIEVRLLEVYTRRRRKLRHANDMSHRCRHRPPAVQAVGPDVHVAINVVERVVVKAETIDSLEDPAG